MADESWTTCCISPRVSINSGGSWMITGKVTSQNEIQIRLPLHNAAGHEQEVEVILDTGFTGSSTLQHALITSLQLRWDLQCDAILANGSVEQFDMYVATVIWDGNPKK